MPGIKLVSIATKVQNLKKWDSFLTQEARRQDQDPCLFNKGNNSIESILVAMP